LFAYFPCCCCWWWWKEQGRLSLTHQQGSKKGPKEGDWINLSFGQQQHALMTGISPHYSMTMTNGPGQGLLLDNLGRAAADALTLHCTALHCIQG
jgi:hypothetical protein